MAWLGVVAAVVLIAVVFLDTFEAMILPRRVAHAYLARLYYRSAWVLWRTAARLVPAGSKLNFQIHYSRATGKTEFDETSVGLRFARQPPHVRCKRRQNAF